MKVTVVQVSTLQKENWPKMCLGFCNFFFFRFLELAFSLSLTKTMSPDSSRIRHRTLPTSALHYASIWKGDSVCSNRSFIHRHWHHLHGFSSNAERKAYSSACCRIGGSDAIDLSIYFFLQRGKKEGSDIIKNITNVP